jgi:hypothetical protein
MKKMVLNLAAVAIVFLGAGTLRAGEADPGAGDPGFSPSFGVAPICCSGGGITCCGKNGCTQSETGCSYW